MLVLPSAGSGGMLEKDENGVGWEERAGEEWDGMGLMALSSAGYVYLWMDGRI